MDDYLSKPFTRERLADVLLRWLPRSVPAPTSVAADPSMLSPVPGEPVAAATEPPINPRAVSYTHLDVYKRQGHLNRSTMRWRSCGLQTSFASSATVFLAARSASISIC